MKKLLIIVLLGGGYYYYLKSNAYTDENIAKLIVEKQSDICGNQKMLEHNKITFAQCNTLFVLRLPSCLARADKKYPGEKYESEEQANQAASEIANCLVSVENS